MLCSEWCTIYCTEILFFKVTKGFLDISTSDSEANITREDIQVWKARVKKTFFFARFDTLLVYVMTNVYYLLIKMCQNFLAIYYLLSIEKSDPDPHFAIIWIQKCIFEPAKS